MKKISIPIFFIFFHSTLYSQNTDMKGREVSNAVSKLALHFDFPGLILGPDNASIMFNNKDQDGYLMMRNSKSSVLEFLKEKNSKQPALQIDFDNNLVIAPSVRVKNAYNVNYAPRPDYQLLLLKMQKLKNDLKRGEYDVAGFDAAVLEMLEDIMQFIKPKTVLIDNGSAGVPAKD